MKRTIVLLTIVMVATLISCSKTKTDPTSQTINTSDLPLKATQYIDTNYPDATIDIVVAISNSSASYIVTLNTTEELAFSREGEYMGEGEQYHHGHGGDDSIHGDTLHGHHGGGHHGGGHHGGGIPVDSLPAAISGYITANYAGYTIRHAEYDSLCPEGLVTEVVLSLQGQEPVKLYFDALAAFLMLDNRVLYADLPQAVKDYVAANYAAYETCHRATKLTMADGTVQYIVYLRQGTSKIKLRIQADGTPVCAM